MSINFEWMLIRADKGVDMEQKYGKLVWTDEDDFEKSYGTDETEDFLEEVGASHAEQDIEQITRVFMRNGNMRSRIFYTKGFRPVDKENGPLRFSVYGVKGAHRKKSRSSYTHWCISREQELLGVDFFNTIFGSYFGTEEEYRTLKEPEEMFRKQQKQVSLEIDKRQAHILMRIMGSLWMVLENDLSARFVIVLSKNEETQDEAWKKAEEESMDILRKIYLMIPQRLRLTIGFAACVTPQEMMELAEDDDLPIHLFTTNSDFDLAVFNNTKYSYHIFRMDEKDGNMANQEKLQILEKLLDYNKGDLLEKLLDISEEGYLQKENKAVSFEAYKTILDSFIVPWYEKDKDNNLNKMIQYREEQEAILACGDLERERRIQFLAEILPNKDYGCQLAKYMVVCKIQELDKKEDFLENLEKCREKLGLGFLIDAIQEASTTWDNYSKKQTEKLQKEIQKLKGEKEKQADQIKELEAQREEKEKRITELQEENQKKQKQITELNGEDQKKEKQITELQEENQKKEKQITELEKEKQKLSLELNAQIDISKNFHNENDKLQKKIEELERDNKSLSKEYSKEKECREALLTRLKEIDDLKKIVKRQDNEIQELAGKITKLENKINEHDDKLNKLKEKKGVVQWIKRLFSRKETRDSEDENM